MHLQEMSTPFPVRCHSLSYEPSKDNQTQDGQTHFRIPSLERRYGNDSHKDKHPADLLGVVGKDQLVFGHGLPNPIILPHQSFGQVVQERGTADVLRLALRDDRVEGIMGLGFDDTTTHTGRPFLWNLVDQGSLERVIFGVRLSNNELHVKSELTLGGLDPAHWIGWIQWHEVMKAPQQQAGSRLRSKSMGQWTIELTAFALRREAFEIDGPVVIDTGFPYIALTRYQAEMINAQIGGVESWQWDV
ncbi:Vacuolar protease A [Modicella reniformis]|uniref:Vacuolar protease A n=1 Tax=Modicella reniformis TaxID=1440133 RepID=A0A9P6MBP6_9FUNG|nr:Vacuolar protease A [Modicella reniformis]